MPFLSFYLELKCLFLSVASEHGKLFAHTHTEIHTLRAEQKLKAILIKSLYRI